MKSESEMIEKAVGQEVACGLEGEVCGMKQRLEDRYFGGGVPRIPGGIQSGSYPLYGGEHGGVLCPLRYGIRKCLHSPQDCSRTGGPGIPRDSKQ